jgi:serine protease Do
MNKTLKKSLILLPIFGLLANSAVASIIDKIFNKGEQPATEINKENKETQPTNTPSKQPCFDATKGFADIVEKVLPAVVNVSTTQVISEKDDLNGDLQGSVGPGGASPLEDFIKRFMDQNNKPRKIQSLGSGFIIKKDDTNFYVVTNFHVVQDAKKIKILMDDKTEVEGKIHASDERTDIAVIKIPLESLPSDKRSKVVSLEWADAETSRVGDWVIAIGNPFGFGSSVTVGVLSHKGRDTLSKMGGNPNSYVDDYIQHSAQINFGNSGGCLLDTNGNVIGINTAIISPSGGNVGIGFAIPSHISKVTVNQLIEFGRTKRGWLGVHVQPFTEEMAESIANMQLANKPIVMRVTKDGPSEKAGIQKEDIILEFDGKPLDNQSRLSRLVGETPVGKSVPIKVWRKGGKEVVLNVVIGEYEDAEQKGQLDEAADKTKSIEANAKSQEVLGITVATLTNQLKERLNVQDKSIKGGIVVLKINPAKVPEMTPSRSITNGDIIVEVNQTEINSTKDFEEVIEKARKEKRENVLLLIMRNNGEPHYSTIKIAEDDVEKKEIPKDKKNG